MTDFTPTTAQVRSFWWMRGTASPGAFVSERQAQFDRWLAAHDAEVLEVAAKYAEQWGDENEEGGYARAAYSVAHAIRCGGVDTSMGSKTDSEN